MLKRLLTTILKTIKNSKAMEEKKVMTVEMTETERKEFEAYKLQKQEAEKKARIEKEKADYKKTVAELVEELFPRVQQVSKNIGGLKKEVYDTFMTVIDIKKELYNVKDGQNWHTFINEDMTKRITIGRNVAVGYDDTVNEGIQKVKDFITSLAGDDEKTQMLVNTVLRLLSKDKKGNLKPEKVLELEKLAEDYNNEEFSEGVKIIRDAYKPQYTKQFVKAEYKDERGEWQNVPMNIVDCE